MRATLVFAFASMWPWATAFGVRGAGERAMFYAAYVAEEVWEDDAKYTVATGCVGSRDHVRLGSAKKRCTLEEFLFHLWEPTEANLLDTNGRPLRDGAGNIVRGQDVRPDPATVARHFQRPANRASKEIGRADVVNMKNAIRSFQVPAVRGAGGSPAGGFTGNLRPGAVFTGLDYFETLEQFGSKLQPTQARIQELLDKAPPTPPPGGELTDEQKKFEDVTKPMLKKWQFQVRLGADLVKYLRIADDASFTVAGIRNNLQAPMDASHFRQKPATAPNGKDHNGRDVPFGISAWQVPDREASIQAAMDAGVSRTDAEAAWQAAVDRYNATPAAAEHARAINSISATAAALAC